MRINKKQFIILSIIVSLITIFIVIGIFFADSINEKDKIDTTKIVLKE